MPFFPLDLIFPPRCVRCRAHLGHGRALCDVCRRRIVLHRSFFCAKCRAHLYFKKHFCHRDPSFLLGAAGEYTDPVLRDVIHSLKFRFVRDAAVPLGAMLADYARRLRAADGYDLILPVPLGWRRRRERGFNQAELIARAFAGRVGIPVETAALRRARHTSPQSALGKTTERLANVADCFEVCAPEKIRGRNVILLDDVITSGATMREAAETLRKAGVKNILALAVAKA